ncbi:16852_t:CDS:2 [Funneliformis caledonium]|uniref:16852_t:CDS:1 n=1 Tax=Funneliformis caledonium TaxID=1117310 RepID=A0A9N9AX29_9GLOM|nr:16852_t:CDS:2 [Funneliformis caledonium]
MRQLREEHENLLDEMKEFDRWNSFINILVVVVWVCIKIQDIQSIDDEEPATPRRNDNGGIIARRSH